MRKTIIGVAFFTAIAIKSIFAYVEYQKATDYTNAKFCIGIFFLMMGINTLLIWSRLTERKK